MSMCECVFLFVCVCERESGFHIVRLPLLSSTPFLSVHLREGGLGD